MFNIQNNRFAMKVKEFEDAIKRMDSRIVLDEVKLSKGQVRRFYGHIGTMLIMWKENGTGHTYFLHTISSEEVSHTTHDGVPESCYDPDHNYDIHFENIFMTKYIDKDAVVAKLKNIMRKKFRIVNNKVYCPEAFHPLWYRIEQRYTILFFIHWWGTPEFEPPHNFEFVCDAIRHIKKHFPNAIIKIRYGKV